MKTIRTIVSLSVALGLAEVVLFADGVRRGWLLANADRDLRI